MDVKLFSSFIILACIGCASSKDASYVPLSRYFDVAVLLNDLKLDNACPQLLKVKQHVEAVMTDAGLRPDTSKPFCQDEEEYPYCSVLSNSRGAPMVGESHPSICSSYAKIKGCYERECGPDGKKFDDPYVRPPSGYDEPSCPKEAKTSCISPIQTVVEVNKDTCVSVAEAKECFVEALQRCSGSSEEQLAVDIILAGLVEHVRHCKKQKYSFSATGDMCVPNPMDVFVPSGFIQKMATTGPETQKTKEGKEAYLKENCPTVEEIGGKLEAYLAKCQMKSNTAETVAHTLVRLAMPRLMCMKAGYNLPCDCSGNSGVSRHHQARGVFTMPLLTAFISCCCLMAARVVFQH